jgi:hypothetical protein
VSATRVTVAVLALALVGALVAAALFIRSYAPLEWAGGASGADTRLSTYYDSVQTTGVDGETVTAHVFRHAPGQTIRLGVDVHNGGRLPVRIEALEPSVAGALHVVGMEVQPNERLKTFRGLRPPPFTLEPGEYVFLVPLFQSGPTCGAEGASQGIDRVRVRYRYLRFFERAETIELPAMIVQACGDPELVARSIEGA